MEDRITMIEEGLADVLKTINTQTTLHGGYTFKNTVQAVNIDDEALVPEFPSITIEMDGGERILSGEQHAFRNEVYYKLVCAVSLVEEEASPRRAINKMMNSLLDDVKATLSDNYHLNDSCDVVDILRSSRHYNKSGDVMRAGNLIIFIRITYSQSRLNPNRNCTV